MSSSEVPISSWKNGESSQLVEKITINVTGMHCAACAANIENSLGKLEGVSKAVVNFANARVYAEYNPAKVTRSTMEQIIEKAILSKNGPVSLNEMKDLVSSIVFRLDDSCNSSFFLLDNAYNVH